ncbi:glycoside hydrolase family 5 protein [Cadophora sp. DSE1049]|nr:glycoside hydrolase family 5 protein [Cadophora sp. DSE1049]
MHLGILLLVASTAVLAVAAPSDKEKRAKNFQFFGVNESGAEFGNGNLPGTLNKDYIWPPTSTIDTLVGKGMNTFRVAFMMERLIPTTMTGTVNQAYAQGLTSYVNYITNTKGAIAVLDPHNFGRYYGNVISDHAAFKAWWTTTAKMFASNTKVVFDCNNEPHDMGSVSTLSLMQACIDGVRAAGATSQYIFVEGTSWSGAWTWVSAGNGDLRALVDPQDKIIYEMHQYLDSDGSGTSTACVSATIGSERIKAATEWLKANNKKGIIGEFAGGNNAQCKSAVTDMLTYMVANKDVWTGALWWGGGPWWGDYMYSFEPPSGVGYQNFLSLMMPFA